MQFGDVRVINLRLQDSLKKLVQLECWSLVLEPTLAGIEKNIKVVYTSSTLSSTFRLHLRKQHEAAAIVIVWFFGQPCQQLHWQNVLNFTVHLTPVAAATKTSYFFLADESGQDIKIVLIV